MHSQLNLWFGENVIVLRFIPNHFNISTSNVFMIPGPIEMLELCSQFDLTEAVKAEPTDASYGSPSLKAVLTAIYYIYMSRGNRRFFGDRPWSWV